MVVPTPRGDHLSRLAPVPHDDHGYFNATKLGELFGFLVQPLLTFAQSDPPGLIVGAVFHWDACPTHVGVGVDN